jgi:hypothetical protein
MKFKNVHPDVERYLAHDCYCPNEIYDPSGFWYELFPADSECEYIVTDDDMVVVLMPKERDPQIVILWLDGSCVADAVRIDATENNIEFIKKLHEGTLVKGVDKIDAFDPEGDRKSMEQLMSLCNGIVIRD